MMKINKPKVSLKMLKAGAASLCIIVTFLLGLLGVFNYYRYDEILRRTVKNNTRLSMLEKDAKELGDFIQRFREERDRFAKVLFSDKDISSFLDKIAEFANKTEVTVMSMKTQRFQDVKIPEEDIVGKAYLVGKKDFKNEEEAKKLTLASLPMDMVIEGEFDRAIDFLLSLEKYRQLLTLTNVEIKRRTYPVLVCSFTLRIYSLKQLDEIVK